MRFPHHHAVAQTRPKVSWLEVHPENYLGGGDNVRYLETLRATYPVSMHGIGLSLGSAGELDRRHLERLRALFDRIDPGLVSDHLSWSSVDGSYLPDLLPLPLTEEALAVVCRHVDEVQTFLRRQILVENPSSYLRYRHSSIPEWQFLSTLAERTGCGILCDVNNVFVSCRNHGWAAGDYLAGLRPQAIGEIHLAGHSVRRLEGDRILLIDDHGSRVAQEVWDLYALALARFGPVPTLVEWDNHLPELEVLLDEAAHAAALLEDVRSYPGRRAAA